jgi:hypothetical protein
MLRLLSTSGSVGCGATCKTLIILPKFMVNLVFLSWTQQEPTRATALYLTTIHPSAEYPCTVSISTIHFHSIHQQSIFEHYPSAEYLLTESISWVSLHSIHQQRTLPQYPSAKNTSTVSISWMSMHSIHQSSITAHSVPVSISWVSFHSMVGRFLTFLTFWTKATWIPCKSE